MVIVGGANVYPAEVEGALEEHPSVVGAVVIGVPDDDMGKRLHALIHLSADVSDDELREWCAPRLSPYKTPRTFERVDEPLRDDAAKVRRSSLTAERSGS
jgi:bile acid-coenzyme A ligase